MFPLFSLLTPLCANAQCLLKSPLHVPVRVTGPSLMIVPVMMNGRGPYDFLLDTGSTETMVDEKFAEEIGLSLSGRTTIVSIQGGEATMFTAEAGIVSVAGAQVNQLTIGVVKSLASVPVDVRGVLGEDFLRNFDLLLDYRHHFLQFDSNPGSLAEMLTGERVPVRQIGDYHLATISNRLILTTRQVFNHERPHEGLNNETPGSLYQPSSTMFPRTVVEYVYPNGFMTQRVNNSGDISWHKQRVFISEVFRFEELGFELPRKAFTRFSSVRSRSENSTLKPCDSGRCTYPDDE